MKEYIDLGHMELVPQGELHKPSYYLPHHAVFRDDEYKKIRVVFNASQRCSNELSLNDVLLPGPKLQKDITLIINSWRCYRFAYTTDIVKMFRQFVIHSEHRDWLRLVWRETANEPLKDYRATTVTYGTGPAPFLALRPYNSWLKMVLRISC